MKSKALAKVKETFNIFNDGRKFHPASRQKWQLKALTDVINHGSTQELIKLGEAVGYWGHGIRELTGKLNPSEIEVVKNGESSVVVKSNPIVRTASLTIDEHGNVTHEQEFLDNADGRAAYEAYQQGVGGFSWCFGGDDLPSGRVARKFFGFDWVRQPNFIPKHRLQGLMSSVGGQSDTDAMLLSSFTGAGYSEVEAQSRIDVFNAPQVEADTLSELALSALEERESKREQLLSSVIDNSLFFVTPSQKDALLRCAPEDKSELDALFSAMQNTDTSKYPVGKQLDVGQSVGHEEEINFRFDG